MPSYRVVTLGCKVNQYESLQVEQLLHSWGYSRTESSTADVVILNTCSVTAGAAAKSRNLLRRNLSADSSNPQRVIALGCWATSHPETARRLAGPNAILTHQDNIATRLAELLGQPAPSQPPCPAPCPPSPRPGTASLPLLVHRQPENQRAILKIQDGCDAHCTYCIIPKLRPVLWSKPIDDVVAECRQLVSAGHREIVLTGIFLGAYGQPTALHDRQPAGAAQLPTLLHALCTQVPGLLRLRLSSLEPGDVTLPLIDALQKYPQIMPHFHLPLQSGSNAILHRMNRQYTREDYLRMVEQIRTAFDRPALTTDIIVGFPGETDACFAETLDLCRKVGFLQLHAFPFSPREGTAAARWKKQFVHPQTVTNRMAELENLSQELSLAYRQQFVGQTAQILVEEPGSSDVDPVPAGDPAASAIRHGRCERYFSIHAEAPNQTDLTGQALRVRITRVTPHRSLGELLI